MTHVSTTDFAAAMRRFGFSAGERLAVAVSGGGDSMALTVLLRDWARDAGVDVLALTVDHGLRPESAAEARLVGARVSALGVEHRILCWEGDKPDTHLQERARAARYGLLRAACRAQGTVALAVAHNLEDQAETFWMRLAHGSGLDGLCGMAAETDGGGVRLIRPVLFFGRAALRETCRVHGVDWVEDPSNENEKFLRVRLRGVEDVLAAEGFSPARLAQTMDKIAGERAALDFYAQQAFEAAVAVYAEGYAVLRLDALSGHPDAVRERVLRRVLQTVYPQDYPAGFAAVAALRADIFSGHFAGRTLAGCVVAPFRGGVLICREAADVRDTVQAGLWDRRFALPPAPEGCSWAALGDAGVRHLRESGDAKAWLARVPARARLVVPALWRGDVLLAVPHAGWGMDFG